RGPRGSEVRLVVERPVPDAEPDTLYFTLRRGHIEIPTVQQAELVAPGIGYLWLTQFTPETPEQVRAALSRLRAQGAAALILDLRNYPGGERSASARGAPQCAPAAPAGHGERRGADRQTYTAGGARVDWPRGVLVNGGSASASEIVAGASQGYETG